MNTFIYRPVLTVVDVLEAGAFFECTLEYIENHRGQIVWDTEKLLRFDDTSDYIKSASNKDGYGGYRRVDGYVYGDVDGVGYGRAYGDGYRDGSGYGFGAGFEDSYGDGDGVGYGYGEDYGDGDGYGNKYGDERPLRE